MEDDLLVERLLPWLRGRLSEAHGEGVSDVQLRDLARPQVGQSSDLWTYRLHWRSKGQPHVAEQVLRRQPPPDGIFLQPDVIREGRILGALEQTPVVVPGLVWSEPSTDVLGRPFVVMEHVAGRVPGAKPSIHAVGWLPTLTLAERSTLWSSAMASLVAVHAVPWRDHLGFLAHGDRAGGAGGHLARLTGWFRWAAQDRHFEIVDTALEWLQDSVSGLSTTDDDVLVWGDARIGNMIFGPDLQVRAVLDWEVATIGPREIDLAHWLIFDELATDAIGVARLEGFPDRDETVAAYEQASSHRVRDLHFYEVQQAFFLATTLIRQADLRVARGELEPGTRMAHENAATVLLARRLGLPVPELSADYQRHRAAR